MASPHALGELYWQRSIKSMLAVDAQRFLFVLSPHGYAVIGSGKKCGQSIAPAACS
jgi:hypothetical protein